MRLAFQVLGKTLRDVFDEFFLLLLCNLIWAGLAAPLLYLAVIALQGGSTVLAGLFFVLAVLPMGPSSAGLAYVAHRICEGRATKLSDFFLGMRDRARSGWLLMGIWCAALLIIVVDIGFYAQMGNLFGLVLYIFWMYALILWGATMIYVFPLSIVQTKPGWRVMARNLLFMVMGRPLFTFTTLFLMSVIFVISFVLLVPLAMITVSLLAVWGMRATLALIEEDRLRREAAEAAATAPAAEKGRRGQVRPK